LGIKVRKAVITAGGWGTRFLPVTKSLPKEMLPLVDKPLIQYSIEEAVCSGIDQVILITARGKGAIEDYFDRSPELERVLQHQGKTELARLVRQISQLVDISYIRQKEQLGLGHAILTARDLVGSEPFAVILPDDIIDNPIPALKQMLEIFEEYQASIIAVERIHPEDTKRYGVVSPQRISGHVTQVLGLVEKPEPEAAPSDLGIVGRYILTPQIFDALQVTPPGKLGEIQITDALQILLEQQAIYAYEFTGTRHDTGTPLGWIKATVALALKRDDIAPELKEYLRGLQ